jgi:hypothetical protein
MNTLEVIAGSLSGGGVLGFLGALGKGWLEIKQARVRIEERKAEAEIQRELVKLKTEQGVMENEAKAFAAAQVASQDDDISDEAWKKVRTPGQVWILLIAEVFRSVTRPALTWATLAVAVLIFFKGDYQTRILIVAGLAAMPGTALGFWFGARPVIQKHIRPSFS